MLEACAQCQDKGTPWAWSEEYKGHICMDCYYDKIEYELEMELSHGSGSEQAPGSISTYKEVG
jgi:hypothetical protein